MNTTDVKRVLEAALLCSPEPLSMNQIRRLFDNEYGPELLRPVLDDLAADWSQRPVQLVPVASGWRFQSRPEYAAYINRLSPEKAPKYSRAVMETLAIIAYRQPVTRGDIEEIRGVSVSAQIIKTLEERGWIDMIGHKEVPGRPSLFGTTRQFLDDLGLRSLKELPSIESLGEDESADFFSEQVLALTSTPGEVVGRDMADPQPDTDADGDGDGDGDRGVDAGGQVPADDVESLAEVPDPDVELPARAPETAVELLAVAPTVDVESRALAAAGNVELLAVAPTVDVESHVASATDVIAHDLQREPDSPQDFPGPAAPVPDSDARRNEQAVAAPDSLEIDELVHLAESLNLIATPIPGSASVPLRDEPDRTDADGNPPGPMERR